MISQYPWFLSEQFWWLNFGALLFSFKINLITMIDRSMTMKSLVWLWTLCRGWICKWFSMAPRFRWRSRYIWGKKVKSLEKSFTYPSCAQGSEPDERFYFHAPVSHCDKVDFKAEKRISHQNCSRYIWVKKLKIIIIEFYKIFNILQAPWLVKKQPLIAPINLWKIEVCVIKVTDCTFYRFTNVINVSRC